MKRHLPTEITKLGELKNLVRQITERQPTIDELWANLQTDASKLLTEIVLQGHDLLSARARVGINEWSTYVQEHIPGLTAEKASRYMRVAKHSDEIGAEQLLLTCAGLEPQPASDAPQRSWPEYVHALGKANKLTSYILKHPLEQWPQEGVEQLREDLLPIAEKLWPGKLK